MALRRELSAKEVSTTPIVLEDRGRAAPFPYSFLEFSTNVAMHSETAADYVLAVAHAVWHHTSIGQLSQLPQYVQLNCLRPNVSWFFVTVKLSLRSVLVFRLPSMIIIRYCPTGMLFLVTKHDFKSFWPKLWRQLLICNIKHTSVKCRRTRNKLCTKTGVSITFCVSGYQ